MLRSPIKIQSNQNTVQSKYSPIKIQSNQNATEGLSYCIRYVDKDILNYEFILKPITIQRYRESFGQLGNTCTPCFWNNWEIL